MKEVNKHGLSRYIESSIEQIIRKDCGFGCVICGDAIYTYEHIDPEFNEAVEHDPEKIALLCSGCHDKVTRGFWSKRKVLEARKKPFCLQQGFSHFHFDIDQEQEFTVKIGDLEFVDLQSIIEIDGETILSVNPPEEAVAPLRVSAKFYDRNNNQIAEIRENEWLGNSEAFDIEATGGKFRIRSALYKIDLLIRAGLPNSLIIEQIDLAFNNTRISGTTTKGFEIQIQNTCVKIPSNAGQIREAPFWLAVKDGKIQLGSDNVGSLNGVDHSGYYSFDNVEVELLNPADVQSPSGPRPGRNALLIRGGEGGGTVLFNPTNPQKSIRNENALRKKPPRNAPCYCGSGRKYKHCHLKFERELRVKK